MPLLSHNGRSTPRDILPLYTKMIQLCCTWEGLASSMRIRVITVTLSCSEGSQLTKH